MKQKSIFLMLLMCLFIGTTYSQSTFGSLSGTIKNTDGEPLVAAAVVLMSGDQQIKGGTTNENGVYNLKPITPGTYTLKVAYIGYETKEISGLIVSSTRISSEDVILNQIGIIIDPTDIVGDRWEKKLVDKDIGPGLSLTPKDIRTSAVKGIPELVNLAPGVQGGSFKGQRTSAMAYYIDGMKVRGELGVPSGAIQEINIITGALPAEYGDVLGGVVVISTRSNFR